MVSDEYLTVLHRWGVRC